MRSYIKYLILLVVLLSIFSIGAVCAGDLENTTINEINMDNSSYILSSTHESTLEDSSSEIIVNDWDDLQYYCSQSDKNYVLKLKEDSNYYPTNPKDEGYQIQVNNNVTIIGNSGAYFGDNSPNARNISYLAIKTSENSGNGITLKGVTFKWISSYFQPNAIFLQMAGNANNLIENCNFYNCAVNGGHSSLIHMVRGDATLNNCTFVNITSDYGCVSIYDPKDDPTKTCTGARMEVLNSYFERNYARTEPGCINNCGVLVVRNSTFYKNTAFWWAGAIHTHGGANTTIYDSNFTDNLAGWNGGALYTYSHLQIYNTIFVGNNCTTNNGGGAIGASKYLHSPYIYVRDSLFIDNENLCWAYTEESTTSLGRGGAISIMDEGNLTVLNTTFIENSASSGTAICALAQGSYYGSPNVVIRGNRFINHTRAGDVLVIKLDYSSVCEIADNYYSGNSIEFSKLKLEADERVGDDVTLHIYPKLKNEKYYDSDILDRSRFDVYVDGQYLKTIDGLSFTLNLKNIEKCQVYVVPSISNSKSNEVSVGLPKEYIYVSQKYGNDNNNGLSRQAPIATLTKAFEIAKKLENILIMDGTFSDNNININHNLTIVGEDNVVISSKDTVFNIVNADVAFKNITFENNVISSSSARIIKQSEGTLEIENCKFIGNSLNTLIETGGTLDAINLEFINNNGVLISSQKYSIESSIFDCNIANNNINLNSLVKSGNGENSKIYKSVFSNNVVKDGCIMYTAASRKSNTLTVLECIFENNTASYSQSSQISSSCICLEDYGLLDVKSSLFINNKDYGKYSAVILTSTEIHVSDSVFLANSFENSNNLIINSKSSSALKKIYCDYNWWGNTADNLNFAPKISSDSNCDNWLFLNATTNASILDKGEKALISLDLNNLITSTGDISYYDASNLANVNFNVLTNGGKSSEDKLKLNNGKASALFTLISSVGNFSAIFGDVDVEFKFSESKVKPQMDVSVDNVMIGSDAVIVIELPGDAKGNLTIDVGKIRQSKSVINSKTVFTISDLTMGQYDVNVLYSGDEYYASSQKNVGFNVTKYNSTATITVGDVELDRDVTLTVGVTSGATGNVTLIINNKEQLLDVVDSKATFTIKSIKRGDYYITAIYNGDSKYMGSSDNVKFGVGKMDPSIVLNVDDIAYGQDAIVEVILNNDATGNVTVSLDDVNKTSEIEKGKAIINIPGLNAGNKEINVIYSGDNVYNSNNSSTLFNIAKADTAMFIKSQNIKIGDMEIIEIDFEKGVSGNVTIVCNDVVITKAINRLGKVTWTLSDLTIGKYEVSASLISDNYNSIENTTEFTVSDYSIPQWPNSGYNPQNGGKSPYSSDVNGEILWNYALSEQNVVNLAIDCEGNIYAVAGCSIYSFDNAGKLRWIYNLTSGGSFSGLAIGRDVIVAPEGGNTLYFINQNTGARFGNSNIYQGSSLFEPVIDSNANIYIASEYQHASGDYKLVIVPYRLWEYGGNPIMISLGNSKPSSAPVIVDDNFAIVACSDSIKLVNLAERKVESSIPTKTSSVRPVAGSNNMIYVVVDNSLREMTLQGTTIWKTAVSGGAGKYIVLDEDNGLYLINSQGNLYKYSLIDGKEKLISNLTFTSEILVDNNGKIYVGANETIYSFDCDGNILWKADMDAKIIGRPIMDESGVIYLTTSSGVVSIVKSSLKEPNLTYGVKDIDYGEVASIVVNLNEEATGIVDVEVNGRIYEKSVVGSTVMILIPDLETGHYSAKIAYSGDGRFKSKEVYASFNVIGGSVIEVSDVTCYVGSNLSITLKDAQGNVIIGEKLIVNIGQKQFNATTGKDGKIAVNLDMGADTYQVVTVFNGNDYLKSSSKTSKVTLLTTIQASNMKKAFNSGIDFKATFLTSDGAPLANTQVLFIVKGVSYYIKTDAKGCAILNKKFKVGTYKATVINPATGENVTKQFIITKRIIYNKNLAMDYLDGSRFKIRVVDNNGNVAGAGEIVTFKIGGKKYTAKTAKNGFASLKINLVPKKYSVVSEYKGYKVSNKITVKQVLKAKNVVRKKAKSYKFSATLKTSKGKAISGKTLKFNIKGKTYSAKTNIKGVATITIKLKLAVGKYIIKTAYYKTSIRNRLTVRR